MLTNYGGFIPSKLYLSIIYFLSFGKKLNWNNPITFNEKLNWLKLNNNKTSYVNYVDKSEVKKLVGKKIGEEYIIPTLGEYTSVDSLNLSDLPEKCVIKTNHDSGTIFIVNKCDDIDFDKIKTELRKSLLRDFSKKFRELPYKKVKRKIIVEKYLESPGDSDLRDYKFFCFNGHVKFLKVDFDRSTNHRANYYTLSWELLPFGEAFCPPDPEKKIIKPKNFEKMVTLAESLAEDIPFVRIDFYNIHGRIFFGEMTFFPAAGIGHFTPESADKYIGTLLKIH